MRNALKLSIVLALTACQGGLAGRPSARQRAISSGEVIGANGETVSTGSGSQTGNGSSGTGSGSGTGTGSTGENNVVPQQWTGPVTYRFSAQVRNLTAAGALLPATITGNTVSGGRSMITAANTNLAANLAANGWRMVQVGLPTQLTQQSLQSLATQCGGSSCPVSSVPGLSLWRCDGRPGRGAGNYELGDDHPNDGTITVTPSNPGGGGSGGSGSGNNGSYPGIPELPGSNASDSDGDGIPNTTEGAAAGSNATTGGGTDTDSDGVPDYRDSDSDNDGVSDRAEGASDSNNDGIPDYRSAAGANPTFPGSTPTDRDGDGIPDNKELGANGTYPADVDGDGRLNVLDSDADNDGVFDGFEGFSDMNRNGVPDFLDPASGSNATFDSDSDGLSDHRENRDGVISIRAVAALPAGSNAVLPTGAWAFDTDADGTLNILDANSDNASNTGSNGTSVTDSLGDSVEGRNGTWFDSNNNGIPAYLDPTEANAAGSNGTTGSGGGAGSNGTFEVGGNTYYMPPSYVMDVNGNNGTNGLVLDVQVLPVTSTTAP